MFSMFQHKLGISIRFGLLALICQSICQTILGGVGDAQERKILTALKCVQMNTIWTFFQLALVLSCGTGNFDQTVMSIPR